TRRPGEAQSWGRPVWFRRLPPRPRPKRAGTLGVWTTPASSRRHTARRLPGSGLPSPPGSATLAWRKNWCRTRSSRHLSTGPPKACHRIPAAGWPPPPGARRSTGCAGNAPGRKSWPCWRGPRHPRRALRAGPAAPSEPESGSGQDEADELLGLIFACCHPSLSRESQIALTLRAVCGLTTAEISAAFLCSESTMGQRLTRARKALQETGSPVRVPDPDQLGARLDEVLAVIYLVFNEGYLASATRTPARRDLAARAVALNRLLHRLMPTEPEVLG